MSNVKRKRKSGNVLNRDRNKVIREGERNRNLILDIVFQNEEWGISPHFLRTRLKSNGLELSRQAIHDHLGRLISEDKIYKNGSLYYPEKSILNDFKLFAAVMAQAFMFMIDKSLMSSLQNSNFSEAVPVDQVLQNHGDINFSRSIMAQASQVSDKSPVINFSRFLPSPSSRDLFLKDLSGPSISQDYLDSKSDDDYVKRNLFEFVNRVGSFIAYIFIESLRPIPKSMHVTEHKKKVRPLYLINEGIVLEKLFARFRLLLLELGIIKNTGELYQSEDVNELDESNFEKLSSSFRSIYPHVFQGLENFWFNSRAFHLKRNKLLAKNSKCTHKWENYYLYKIGTCLRCKRCHILVEKKKRKRKTRL